MGDSSRELWVCRDVDGCVWLTDEKPVWNAERGKWQVSEMFFMELPVGAFGLKCGSLTRLQQFNVEDQYA